MEIDVVNRGIVTGVVMIMKPRWFRAFLLLTAASAAAQSPPGFEVASIKRNLSGSDGTTINTLPGGRFVAANVTLMALIESAYGLGFSDRWRTAVARCR